MNGTTALQPRARVGQDEHKESKDQGAGGAYVRQLFVRKQPTQRPIVFARGRACAWLSAPLALTVTFVRAGAGTATHHRCSRFALLGAPSPPPHPHPHHRAHRAPRAVLARVLAACVSFALGPLLPRLAGPAPSCRGSAFRRRGANGANGWIARRECQIICTLGPACATKEKLVAMIDAGMTVARLNFSHGDHDSHGAMVSLLREAMAERPDNHVAVLLDTKGPEIRTGFLKDGEAKLEEGQTLEITTDYEVRGCRCCCSALKQLLPCCARRCIASSGVWLQICVCCALFGARAPLPCLVSAVSVSLGETLGLCAACPAHVCFGCVAWHCCVALLRVAMPRRVSSRWLSRCA